MDEKIGDSLRGILDEIGNDQECLIKLHEIISVKVPAMISQFKNKQHERVARSIDIEDEVSAIVADITSTHGLCYLNHVGSFYVFKSNRFVAYSEDDVYALLLRILNEKPVLKGAKFKFVQAIIKRLKSRTPFHIQLSNELVKYIVLDFGDYFDTSSIVSTHLLCCIGDAILGKKENTYIVPPVLKHTLLNIDSQHYAITGQHSVLSNFKYKHHNHNYNKTRFLHFKLILGPKLAPAVVVDRFVDFITVCHHLSNKHGSADMYLESLIDTPPVNDLRRCVFFTRHLDQCSFVRQFVSDALKRKESSTMTKKDMLLTLKCYLRSKNIPNIIFHDRFVQELSLIIGSTPNSIYQNYESIYLGCIKTTTDFWRETMTETDAPCLYTADELLALFRTFSPKEYFQEEAFYDGILIDIIKWIVPESIVEERGILINYSCKLFPKAQLLADYLKSHKHAELDCFLQYLKKKGLCDSLIATMTIESFKHEILKHTASNGGALSSSGSKSRVYA